MTEIRFPTVWNPKTNCIYVDDPYSEEPTYDELLMDVGAYRYSLGGGNSKAASTAQLHQIFYNNGSPDLNMHDLANEYYDRMVGSRAASTHVEQMDKAERLMRDRKFTNFQNLLVIAGSIIHAQRKSKAGAVITSLDYTDFQDTNRILGENPETAIRTGILASLFTSISVPNLAGRWQSFSNDLKYYRNLPESKSPEPSKGTGAITSVSVQKHGGAVAITQRAQAVINTDDPFARLVTQMGQKRLFDENDMIADEIEANTANTFAGVDFGLRAGTPPLSSTNPIDFLITLTSTFEAVSQPVNLFISRGTAYWEYAFNDIVRGGALAGNPLPSQGTINEQISPFPGVDGVRWARDNAITSLTAGWALNDNAIKLFRGPSRNYTVANEDTETTKYVTKNYFTPETVDSSIIYKVTGITA